MTTESLAISCALLAEAYVSPERLRGYYEDDHNPRAIHEDFGLEAIRGILIASVAVLLPLVLMVYQLAGFHIMLIVRNMTTYDFIVYQQKRQRERDAEKANKKREAQLKEGKKINNGKDAADATITSTEIQLQTIKPTESKV